MADSSNPITITDPIPIREMYFGDKTRCHAHSKVSGLQCARPAVPGATVCIYHGGSAPQVRAAAQLRILAMVDPALCALAREIRRKSAKPNAVAVQAAKDILDRAGLAATAKLEITGDLNLLAKLQAGRARLSAPDVPSAGNQADVIDVVREPIVEPAL